MRTPWLVLLLSSAPALAQVYSDVDAQGNRVFTDRPLSSSARPVEIRSGNVMPPVPTAPRPEKPTTVSIKRAYYTGLNITSPAPETTIRGAGDVAVSVSSTPALLPGHGIRILLDGVPVAGPEGGTTFDLSNLDRGTRQLSADIVDAQGKVLLTTEARPLFVHRPSLSQMRRVNPCARDEYGSRPECPIEDKPPEPRKRFLGLF